VPTPAARRLRNARFEFQTRDEAAATAEYVATLLPESVRGELSGLDSELFGVHRVRQILSSSAPEDGYRTLSLTWREYAGEVGISDDLSIIEVIV